MINNKYIFPIISSEDKQLPIYVVTVGVDIFAENDLVTIRPKGIPDHQFIFTTSGKAQFFFGDSKRYAEPGSFIYHAPNTPHYYEAVSKEPWVSHWITFSMQHNFSLFELKNGVYDFNDVSPFTDLIEDIISLKNNFGFGEKASVLLYKMILMLKRYLAKSSTVIMRNDIDSILRPSLDYINEHFTEDIPLSTLASLAGITPGYYCKIFKDYYHIRPLEYVRQLRIQYAKTLLVVQRDLSVSDIGEKIGYQNPSYFIKQFKKFENITPKEFRKQHV